MWLWRGPTIVGTGNLWNGVYQVQFSRFLAKDKVSSAVTKSSADIWHTRIVHADKAAIERTAKEEAVAGIEDNTKIEGKSCSSCIIGKMANGSMRLRTTLDSRPGAVVHWDVAQIIVPSLGGNRYYVTFIDEASNYVRAVPLKKKFEASKELDRHVAWVQMQTGRSVVRILIDGGREYVKAAMIPQDEGIKVDNTSRYTLEENKLAERMNRTLMNSFHSMLVHAGAPDYLWTEFLLAAANLRNAILKRRYQKIPTEILLEVRPSISCLRTFGYLTWARVPEQLRN